MKRALLTLGLLACAAEAYAQDSAQYRHLELSDGRTFEAIILATEPSGFKVKVPQGEMKIPFPLLRDMVPSDKAAYDAQPDWYVYLAVPEERRRGVAAAFEAIPHVDVHGMPGAPAGRLTAQQEQAAAGCGTDISCVGTATKDAPWMWVVSVNQEGTELVFESRTNLDVGPARNPLRAQMIDGAKVGQAAWTALELVPNSAESVAVAPTDGKDPAEPKEAKAPKEPKAGGGGSSKLAYVPLPGAPALANGDMGGFGLAMAVAVPATALWVNAVGHEATRPVEHVALGVGGFYALTLAVNHAVAGRGAASDVVVGMQPSRGGAAVSVTVAR